MKPGILSAALATLALGGLVPGCRQAADPGQLQAVDGMITSLEAAMLTLNELDHGRYLRADSLFQQQQGSFNARFRDTLDRSTADKLGNHFLVLRASGRMGDDHMQLLADLTRATERLRNLRQDLSTAVMDPEQGALALARERITLHDLEANVHRAIDNYRTVQRMWEERDTIDTLLDAERSISQHAGR